MSTGEFGFFQFQWHQLHLQSRCAQFDHWFSGSTNSSLIL